MFVRIYNMFLTNISYSPYIYIDGWMDGWIDK